MKKSGSINAFTIIELIILILIAGLMAAAFASISKSPLQNRIQTAAHKIKSDIRYAQSYALASQKRTRLAFNLVQESYTVYAEVTPDTDNWAILADPLTRKGLTVTFGQAEYNGVEIIGTNFVSANYDLVFDKRGIPWGYNPSNGSESQLVSEGSVTISGNVSIKVEPNIGKVSI
jgi:Tfp pilus assembly protein FimT